MHFFCYHDRLRSKHLEATGSLILYLVMSSSSVLHQQNLAKSNPDSLKLLCSLTLSHVTNVKKKLCHKY